MSESELYLRELRRALPIGCRRRFVAEVREHFASAGAAGEEERLTIERLGPARALADQLLADLRSGALGPVARFSAVLTVTRIALATVLVLAVVVGVAVVSVRSSSKSPPPSTVHRALDAGVVHNGVLVQKLVLTLATVQQRGKLRALPNGYVVIPRTYYAQSP